jgi:hypothetical protein
MLTLSATRFVAALFATTALASFGHIAGEEFAPNSDLQVRHIASENGTSAHLFNSIPECGVRTAISIRQKDNSDFSQSYHAY